MTLALAGLILRPVAPWDPREMAPDYLARWRAWTRGEEVSPSHLLPTDAGPMADGLYLFPGVLVRATTRQLHAGVPVRVAWESRLFAAETEVELFGGPRSQSLPFWHFLYEPEYEIYTWDLQPIVGRGTAPEERHRLGYVLIRPGSGLRIWIGRQRLRLGPGLRYAADISGYSGPLDFIYRASYQRGGLTMEAGAARVPDTIASRYFAYQRVELRMGPLVASLGDGVLWHGDPFEYINPMALYYDIQRHESDNQANMWLTAEASLRLLKGARAFVQFLGDDPAFISRTEAPLWAGVLGANLEVGQLELWAEAAASPPWTYAHYSGVNSAYAMDIPLCLWVGSDVVAVYGHLARLFPGGELRLFGERVEKGGTPPLESPEEGGNRPVPWPTLGPEPITNIGLSLSLHKNYTYFYAKLGNSWPDGVFGGLYLAFSWPIRLFGHITND